MFDILTRFTFFVRGTQNEKKYYLVNHNCYKWWHSAMHLLKIERVQCFATEKNMIYKHDFFFCARISQWVDGKLLNSKFIGYNWLRMPKVALLKSKKILHIMS